MNFSYLKPKTLEEAINLKETLGDKAEFFAGGSDLLLKLKRKLIAPEHIISLSGIEELKMIESAAGQISIGALTTLSRVEKESVFKTDLPVLAETAKKMASPQIRQLATIGGNIANASPAADMAPPLIALGARVTLRGVEGERTLLIEDFFIGPGKSVLKDSEILTKLIIPIMPTGSKACYLKESIRKGHDVALAGAGVMIRLGKDRTRVEEARIVLGAVAPIPLRAVKAEALLMDNKINNQLIEDVALLAADASQPIDDIRTTAVYRKKLIKALVSRAIQQLLTRGGN